MTFDNILNLKSFVGRKGTPVDQIREQRQLASDVIAGFLHEGMSLSATEHDFVRKINKSMVPIDLPTFTVLEKIALRRWAR